MVSPTIYHLSEFEYGKEFDEIDRYEMEINKIIEKLGIELNPMQEAVSEAFLRSNKDIIVLSPTGSGKTYAYLLPLIQLLDVAIDEVQAVVAVPGRELAKQSANVVLDMKSGLRPMAVYGGRPTMDEHREMRSIKPQILFATPGRLMIILIKAI